MYIEYYIPSSILYSGQPEYILGNFLEKFESWSITHEVAYKIKWQKNRFRIIFSDPQCYTLFALTFDYTPTPNLPEYEWTKHYQLKEPMNLTHNKS